MSIATLRFTNQGFSDAMSHVFRARRRPPTGTKRQAETLAPTAERPAGQSWPAGRIIRRISLRIGLAAVRRVVELAVPGAVEKAVPFIPVEHQDPAGRVARHPHQHPVAPGPARAEREGDLDRPVAIAGPLPDQASDVDAELVRCRLALGARSRLDSHADGVRRGAGREVHHGTLATAQ